MLSQSAFAEQVQDAYRHLYEIAYLRDHPLGALLLSGVSLSPKERAWRLHRLLIEVIDELDPGFAAPTISPEWRRHRLLVLRYQDGLSPQEIADELAISRRHFYREHDAALAAIVELLWQRHLCSAEARYTATPTAMPSSPDRLELLRREAAPFCHDEQGASLEQVLEGLQMLFAEVARQNEVCFAPLPAKHLPRIAIDPSLLRQLLIGVVGGILRGARDAVLRFEAQAEASGGVQLSILLAPSSPTGRMASLDLAEHLPAVHELAALNQVEIQPASTHDNTLGVRLRLPCRRQHTVLVVDDNEDALHLFERYLVPNHYHVVKALTGAEAVRRAKQAQPDAILLDLMMPEQDGWDLLRIFRSDESTRAIPVIVCSILRQAELALAFGADAFLEKPLREEQLLATLAKFVASG